MMRQPLLFYNSISMFTVLCQSKTSKPLEKNHYIRKKKDLESIISAIMSWISLSLYKNKPASFYILLLLSIIGMFIIAYVHLSIQYRISKVFAYLKKRGRCSDNKSLNKRENYKCHPCKPIPPSWSFLFSKTRD